MRRRHKRAAVVTQRQSQCLPRLDAGSCGGNFNLASACMASIPCASKPLAHYGHQHIDDSVARGREVLRDREVCAVPHRS